MKQLVQLQKVYDEFEKRDIEVIAVSLEAAEMEQHAKTLKRFPNRRFKLAGALNWEGMDAWARTTGYLIDKTGVIRQVFPMETYNRPDWWSVLNEADRLLGK
ncbi:MAG: hypothetical protein QNK37_30350 [Acidobacteriota bacterium]|nr:hypothetical protein [Acidobacteriota bacterium]